MMSFLPHVHKNEVLADTAGYFLPYKVLGNFPTSPLVSAHAQPVLCPFQFRSVVSHAQK